jgi:outer membrane receptor protein involved in Fe transport
LDKYGLRYEGYELAGWLPRLAAGFYRQKYSFADDNFTSAINAGSSWTIVPDANVPNGRRTTLTGRPSDFTTSNFTNGKNTVTSHGSDLQATLAPRAGGGGSLLFTSGVGYLRDLSRDEFSRLDFTAPPRFVTGRASNPDAVYQNLGWFNLVEYEPAQWLCLTGGWRIDNWRSQAKVTRGFPLGAETLLLDVSLDRLLANPGRINVDGLRGVAGLVHGASGLETDKTSVTGNVGVVVRTPSGVHPYLRWANSYREPGVTERYILRNFGAPNFSILLAANTALKPERGRGFDVGIKAQRTHWRASFGYFRNDFSDFMQVAFSNVLLVPADPARGLDPLAPGLPMHGVLYAQRTNTARARIQGFEGIAEAGLRLGRLGALTPFATLGWLKGENLTPDQNALTLIRQFYNRVDTPILLKGAAGDVPLTGITPFRGVFGVRFGSAGGAWFGQYQSRYQARVSRVDPLDLSTNILTQYGLLASLDAFVKQSLRGGYTWRGDYLRVLFSLGVENLTGRLYFEQFQNAPAPGRTLLFGVTFELTQPLSR